MKINKTRNLKLKIYSSIALVITLLTSLLTITFSNLSASAINSETFGEKAMKIALVNGLRNCYNNNSYIRYSLKINEYTGISSLVTSEGRKAHVLIPTRVGNTVSDAELSCEEVLTGKRAGKPSDSAKGLLQLFGTDGSSDFSDVTGTRYGSGTRVNFSITTKPAQDLITLGYELDRSAVSGDDADKAATDSSVGCLGVTYHDSSTGDRTVERATDQVCFTFNGTGDDAKITTDSWYGESPDFQVKRTATEGTLNFSYSASSRELIVSSSAGGEYHSSNFLIKSNATWKDIKDLFNDKVLPYIRNIDMFDTATSTRHAAYDMVVSIIPESDGASGGGSTLNLTYKKPGGGATPVYNVGLSIANVDILRAVTNLRDVSWGDYTPAIEDNAVLMRTYIQKEIDDSKNINLGDCFNNKAEAATKAAEVSRSTFYAATYHISNSQWCVISVPEPNKSVLDQKVNIWTIFGLNTGMTKKTLKEVIELQAKDEYDAALSEITDDGSYLEGVTDPDASGDLTPKCYEAAESLGWILCPAINGVAAATQGLYSYIESNFLAIDSGIFDGPNSLFDGWSQFRDIANIAFVILFIVIILSQITGIGVSNYGIKKTLPRLIAVVILANLSYIICELAIDVSNIVGFGMKQLFYDLAKNIVTIGDFTSNIVLYLFAGAAEAAVGIAVFFAAVHNWQLWLLPLLLFLLTVIVSVLFFAIILGVRQAGIIILIALAPVAIVCYALPNTKKLFDNWFKLFKALLIVFPVCGLLMGGGVYASSLLLTVAEGNPEYGFFFTLVAMLVQVVPFFLVPGLVKGSLALAGNIGAKISNIGSGLGRSATKSIRSSEGYKDMQRQNLMSHRENRFNRLEAGKGFRNRVLNGIEHSRLKGTKIGSRVYDRLQGSVDRSKYRDNAVFRSIMESNLKAKAGTRSLSDKEKQGIIDKEKKRQRDILAENSQASFESNRDFMNGSPEEQQSVFERALDALEEDPGSDDALADVRALQNILASTDPGQEILQNTYNKRMFEEQEAAKQENREARISNGMRIASDYLKTDFAKLKPTSRSFYTMVDDLSHGRAIVTDKKDNVIGGVFAKEYSKGDDNIKEEEGKFFNAHYDGYGGKKMNGQNLNAMNETSIKRIIHAIKTGDISDSDFAMYADAATDALTNPQINVSNEYADDFNRIREAYYNKQRQELSAGGARANNYFDRSGREFVHQGGNQYEYTDSNKNKHLYRRDQNGNLNEVNGSEVIKSDETMTADQAMRYYHGSTFQKLKNNDTLNIEHDRKAPPRKKINLPQGWYHDGAQWMRLTPNGPQPLSRLEAKRAEAIEDHNNKIDIENASS